MKILSIHFKPLLTTNFYLHDNNFLIFFFEKFNYFSLASASIVDAGKV
ncbi:hypothetical protein PSPO_b1362 [Pseudoalteromonas spongiae UST010723-006]|nr:hypothetical protein PSPO_b1362 [Pseudoalteromonas spongiae UST010723-006]